MTSRHPNTIEDIGFAILYLDYMSRRAIDAETRARSQVLLGLVRLLDSRYPGWKEAFLADLNERGETREIASLLTLEDDQTDRLFNDFLASLTKGKDQS